MKAPYVFDEFFVSNLEESISPFLTLNSQKWGKNLSLKSASIAAFLLCTSLLFSYISPPTSSLFLSFVFFLVGTPALLAAFDDLKNFEINIDVLMTLAAFIALLMGNGLEGALLLVLFELSHSLEETVSRQTTSALHSLNKIAPKKASVVSSDGEVVETSIHEITIGTTLLVKQGEIVPLDGEIIQGASSLNLVHLTGESLPVFKKIKDRVPAGARNLESSIYIKVTTLNQDSTLHRIIGLIRTAQEAKPRVQNFLDRFGQKYAWAVILLTFSFGLFLPFLFPISFTGEEGSIYRALAFLIAASPCALIIATPTAYLSSISASAKKGILLKGGAILDSLANISIVAFDKTGTLTTGELTCLSVHSLQSGSIEEALSVAYGLEQHVVHPIATSICKFAQSKQISSAHIENIQVIPGFGIQGSYKNTAVKIGLAEYTLRDLTKKEEYLEWISTKKQENQVLSTLCIGNDVFLFQFSDQIRKEAPSLLRKLKQNKILPVMLTGDNSHSANHVAKKVGISEVFANLRPEDKLLKITELSSEKNLAMVGDGMNDAPSLARAHVGISMGRIGSATAVDASDVILLNDDLDSISWLFSSAKKTQNIIKQNLSLALGVICFASIPALFGLIPLWTAVLLHEGGTLLVGLNSLRLLSKKS